MRWWRAWIGIAFTVGLVALVMFINADLAIPAIVLAIPAIVLGWAVMCLIAVIAFVQLRPRDSLLPTLREVLSALRHRTSPDRWAAWQARNAAALARLQQAYPAVVPPRVELPRTFTERSGYVGPFVVLLIGAIGYGLLARNGFPAALCWGALVCASALALIAWFSAETRQITCTEQGLTVSTRSRLSGLRQSVCLWSDVTATTYTYAWRWGSEGGGLPEATFAVETSQGTAVTFSDRHFGKFFFEEFVAICNTHTPQLPYIWEHHPREVFQPDYFQVPQDRGSP
jgi:hypothetical protein